MTATIERGVRAYRPAFGGGGGNDKIGGASGLFLFLVEDPEGEILGEGNGTCKRKNNFTINNPSLKSKQI